jgi:hypothetical protein
MSKKRITKLEDAKALMAEAMAEFEGQTVTPQVNEAIRDKIEAIAEENTGMWVDYLQRFVRLARPGT